VRAVVLQSGTLSLQDRPIPRIEGECLIRVTAAGICGTDLELLRGYAEFSGVPGHEFVGVVESADAADAEWIGRRIAGEITVGCGRCAGCRAAGTGHCDVRTVVGIRDRDGAFAEYLSLPSRNLHALPTSMDDVTAVFVEQVSIDTATRAAVVGAGRLGLLVAQVLRAHGADVIVVTRSQASASVAAALRLETISTSRAAASLARQCDVVVDVTGEPAGFAAAARLVRPRGTLVVKSTIHGETPVPLTALVVDEITIVGSRCGPFSRAIALLDEQRIEVRPLVAAAYPLERFEDAFEHARRGMKVLLVPYANHSAAVLV
jgi:alcohol dehydrogenase